MTKSLEQTTAVQSSDPSKRKAPTLSVHEDEKNTLQIAIDGDYSRISNKTNGKTVALGLIGQIASLGSQGTRVDQEGANFALGFVDAMSPKDAAEALLLTQMAATHQATMMMARRLNHIGNLPQQDSAERALNKLARSYAAQMDTLKRYRSKGQQTVRVERVTVQDGGQAIVGNVDRGGRGSDEI
ncbi:hypothetical protein [Roseovarius sp. D0-M9]|uniref:hypothetical protein n=1 Tax=Roseovarius sp. D0-M9 TaxID=3127117 RepID=UPI00300F8010